MSRASSLTLHPLGFCIAQISATPSGNCHDQVGMLLERLGAEVDVVHDGSAAVATFASRKPSVVLLDLGMPHMDGYEVARTLRREFSERPTIIALTGRGQPEDRRKAREAGIDHHLVKPAQLDALRDLLGT